MSRSTKQRNARDYNGWNFIKTLGRGGNGEVWHGIKLNQEGAVKELLGSVRSEGRVARFRDEIAAMKKCADICGVMPVLDEAIDLRPDRSPWFVMPCATPISKAFEDTNSLACVVSAVQSISSTLVLMHERDIAHRDLKPDNLFQIDKTWTVGDFGLAEFQGKLSKTLPGEKLGPLLYIAPEMLNSARESSGKPADVFSLAKTLWVLATGQKYPLPGPYDPTHDVFRLGSYVQEERTGPLDKLLAAATSHSPQSRPTMRDMQDELAAWLEPKVSHTTLNPMLDLRHFAAKFDLNTQAQQAEKESAAREFAARKAVADRLTEALRPFAEELKAAFVGASLPEVELKPLENGGFEIFARIPSTQASAPHIKLSISAVLQPTSLIEMGFKASVFQGDQQYRALLWDKSVTFLNGGSDEPNKIMLLCEEIRRHLQNVIEQALQVLLESGERVAEARHYTYGVYVEDKNGTPIEGADVFILNQGGLYDRAKTNEKGLARSPNTPAMPVSAFVAHPDFRGANVPIRSDKTTCALERSDGIGSLLATRGWISLPSLNGQVDLISDTVGQEGRLYVYSADGVSIGHGAQEPVQLNLGEYVHVRARDGSSINFMVKASRGKCFLIEVRK